MGCLTRNNHPSRQFLVTAPSAETESKIVFFTTVGTDGISGAVYEAQGRYAVTTADTRPFYSEFAWAYDLIIPAPVQVRCKFWSEVAGQRGLARGSRVVDAGCGTGGYTLELARMGYEMTGIDVSPDLIAVAETKARKARLPIKSSVTDIRAFSGVQRYDGILCRGVLNDFVTDAERRAVCRSLVNALRCGGLLVLDVREWYRTALIKREQPPV